MGENSKIEWTDHSFNPWVGCTKISPGCDHCYAEGWSRRSGLVVWGMDRRRTSEANWRQPLKWDAEAKRAGVRRRVFCASLADVFDKDVPERWRADLFALIRKTPNLDWLLLTKRVGNAWSMIQRAMWDIGMHPGMHHSLLANAWLGATVVSQEEADRDVPKLKQIPAAVRFLSLEPLLGPIELPNMLAGFPQHITRDGRAIGAPLTIHWVIVGGESGPGARPFVLGWGKEIVRQCRDTGVACFVKQVGARPVNREGQPCPHILDRKGKIMEEWPQELRIREFPRQ